MLKEAGQYKVLTTLSLQKEEAISCGFPGCSRTVYAEIYVILDTRRMTIHLLGSECYKKLLKGHSNVRLDTHTSVSTSRVKSDAAVPKIDLEANESQLLARLAREDLRGLVPFCIEDRISKLCKVLRAYTVSEAVVERLHYRLVTDIKYLSDNG